MTNAVEIVARSTFWQRLGFGYTSGPDMEDLEALDDHCWAPGYIIVRAKTHFNWRDRLRLLISGRLLTVTHIKTSAHVRESVPRTATSVLPPSTDITRD